MHKNVSIILSEAAEVYNKMKLSDELIDSIVSLSKVCIGAISDKKKILFAGNGGSAADAQHLTAELVNRFNYDRPAIAALALTTDTSVITSISNDSDYENIFSRQIEALGTKGDILIVLSTSGNSANISKAATSAVEKGLIVAGFTGSDCGSLQDKCDYLIKVPSKCTPRIQEGHILMGHILCGLIEDGIHRQKE